MAPNKAPIFGEKALQGSVGLTNQTLTRDGLTAANGGAILLCTAGSDGGYIEAVWIQPCGDVSANVVRFFWQEQGQVTNQFLFEANVAAVAGSNNTSAIARTNVQLPDTLSPTGSFALVLPSGAKLFAALGTASGSVIRVNVQGKQYSTT